LIGRESELATTAALLADFRLVTLTGVGGLGKTSLALEVASQVADRFPTSSQAMSGLARVYHRTKRRPA
jgi:predicted ATPase